jgi:prepilin-type N-terminal cleavage/methylation domain-containing protein
MTNPNFKLDDRQCSGFTLVELLLVIAILGVLTTMALAFMRNANEQARVAATQSRIKKIEAILNAELERYEVRRLPISRQELADFVAMNPAPGIPSNIQVNNMRKRLIQDLINCELPRPILSGGVFFRNTDLGHFPSNVPAIASVTVGFRDWLNNHYSNPGPGWGDQLFARTLSAAVVSWSDPSLSSPNFDLPGEYLYQILRRIDFDGMPAIESLGTSTFADTDNDGIMEVVDAWGEPLLWLIVQVDVLDATVSEDKYEDQLTDWTRRDADGMPQGYAPLNPVIPRDLQQIRITVFSQRLNQQGIYNTN